MARGGHDTTFDYHRRMIDDAERMLAYERALRARVRPGDVVLDLGCGTGILAMLAARCGAARVHAVESLPLARLARQLAAANGLDDRVVVHEADVATLPPVEPVDLVVGDFMGRFVVDDAMLHTLPAAGRWLKPGGAFLPRRIRMLLAPAGGFRIAPLDWVEASAFGIDLRPLAPYVQHASYGGDFPSSALLAPGAAFAEIVPPEVPPFAARLSFTAQKSEQLRGLLGWFEADLADGITLSTAPGIATHWGQVLLPLPATAVEVGDEITADVRLVEEAAWEYEWQVTVRRGSSIVLEAALDTRWRPGERAMPVTPHVTGDPVEINERGSEAWEADRHAEALRLWEEAARALPVRGHEWTAPIYENLGVAYMRLGQPRAAERAFLRALDGDPDAREQSRRLLFGIRGKPG